jgi:hypothetical protein
MKDSNISSKFYQKLRWVYIPMGIIIYMCLGTVYSWSVFRKPLESLLHINATQKWYSLYAFSIFLLIVYGNLRKFYTKI